MVGSIPAPATIDRPAGAHLRWARAGRLGRGCYCLRVLAVTGKSAPSSDRRGRRHLGAVVIQVEHDAMAWRRTGFDTPRLHALGGSYPTRRRSSTRVPGTGSQGRALSPVGPPGSRVRLPLRWSLSGAVLGTADLCKIRPEGSIPFASTTTSERGGIGRHAGLRGRCRKA